MTSVYSLSSLSVSYNTCFKLCNDYRSTARLEQSAGRDPSQHISGCLQTFTQNSLLYSVFLLTLFLITFNPRAVDIVKCPWSSFFYLRHFNIDYCTLHYITYIVSYRHGAQWIEWMTNEKMTPSIVGPRYRASYTTAYRLIHVRPQAHTTFPCLYTLWHTPF